MCDLTGLECPFSSFFDCCMNVTVFERFESYESLIVA